MTPSITTTQGKVHYEVLGRGQPVVLLHGWLGSWGLWQETMQNLGGQYRSYALDFWGFGDSGKRRASYSVTDFSQLVVDFMDSLGIARAPLVGHSMGGTVGLLTAINFPERISKVRDTLALLPELAAVLPDDRATRVALVGGPRHLHVLFDVFSEPPLRVRVDVSGQMRVRPSEQLVADLERICGPGSVTVR